MTYKQRMEIDNPIFINKDKLGGVYRCPFVYGYDTKENSMKNCTFNNGKGCEYCWNREEKGEEKVMKELNSIYTDVLDDMGWSISCYTDDDRVELQQYSPAGEDFSFVANVNGFPDSVREYANDFDADEHALEWANARNVVSGVPDLRTLIDDADEIQNMLNMLDCALMDANRRYKTAKKLWLDFGDVPIDLETECIEVEWNGFPVGTHREEIWLWFEEEFNISVAKDLMGL